MGVKCIRSSSLAFIRDLGGGGAGRAEGRRGSALTAEGIISRRIADKFFKACLCLLRGYVRVLMEHFFSMCKMFHYHHYYIKQTAAPELFVPQVHLCVCKPKDNTQTANEILSTFPPLYLTVRETSGRNTKRPVEECCSFCGPAHTAGPALDSGSLNQQNLIQNRIEGETTDSARWNMRSGWFSPVHRQEALLSYCSLY